VTRAPVSLFFDSGVPIEEICRLLGGDDEGNDGA
jgi:hypothetical protein